MYLTALVAELQTSNLHLQRFDWNDKISVQKESKSH